MKKRGIWLFAVLLLTVLLICGCEKKGNRPGITLAPQELYHLPALPDKYTELNQQLSEILSGGAEYAAPVSGSNLQPVQMQDLDGDGQEEALAFFRNSADEKPLKIYIFTMKDETYQRAALIEGSGTAIHSVVYSDLDGDGRIELAVGWRTSPDLLALSVYNLPPEGPREVVRTNYVRYSMLDMNRDDRKELVVLRSDEEGSGVADYYGWTEDKLTLQSSARISMTMAQLRQQGRVTRGTLRSGETALFLTGVETAAETAPQAVFDVLIVKNGDLMNAVLADATGVSAEIAPFCSLYPTDLIAAGCTAVPWPIGSGSDDGEPSHQFVEWRSYDDRGRARTELCTYHNVEDGWYLSIPANWQGQVQATRSVLPDEAGVTFSVNRGGESKPFLRITAITGSNRMAKAARGNRFSLSRQVDTMYVAELLEANRTWRGGVTEDEVRAAFSLIKPEWSAGDN